MGVIDIGTNSVRLLLADNTRELGRWEEVTGLGRGLDATGELSDSAVADTLAALYQYGRLLDEAGVAERAAVATSASRNASNTEEFFDRAEQALGVRPALISGEEEAALAYHGATPGLSLLRPIVVSDIGGGSTEFASDNEAVSVEIGSVRLTESLLPNRPASKTQMAVAREEVTHLFASVQIPATESLVGVAGTWNSLAAIAQDLPDHDLAPVHGHLLARGQLLGLVDHLGKLTIEQTATIPALHPARAPVILAGAVVAAGVMEATGADEAYISGRDTLDGVATKLLALV